jgi:hypothetical protein
MSVAETVDLVTVLTRENAIILILILLLFVDRVKLWITILEQAYRKWLKLDKKKANKNLEDYATRISKIHEILEMFRNKAEAARTAYYVLHNGGTDIRGIPFLKYSCLNESTAYGIRPRLRLDKDAHIANVSPWTKNFIASTPAIGKLQDLPNHGIRTYLEEFGIIYYAIMPIYDDSLLSGFVVFEWNQEKFIPEYDEIKDEIIQCAQLVEMHSVKKISHFLSY